MSSGTHQRSPDQMRLDAAISRFLDSMSDDDFGQLVAFGPVALDRAIELYYHGTDRGIPPLSPVPAIRDRSAVDAWSALVGGLGKAFPERFIDQMGRDKAIRADSLLVVGTLGSIEGSRAQEALIKVARHRSVLVRYHAIKGLKWRDDREAVAVVEWHLSDRDPLVRLEAIRGVARRDPKQARILLSTMADDASIPPLIRAEARTSLSTLG